MPAIPTPEAQTAPAQIQGWADKLTDLDLARKARADRSAISELYRRHFKRVYGYHLARTGNVDDAQDLTSQTFMAVVENIHRFDGRGAFCAWLMSIAHHKMAQHYRRKRPEADLEAGENLPAPTARLEDTADRNGLVRQLRAALLRLTPERAEALILRTYGGLDAAETARVLGKSQGAVKMLAHRAIQDLREMIGADRNEEEA